MTTPPLSAHTVGDRLRSFARWSPSAVTALALAVLFWTPARTLVDDWLKDPDAAHGLLLAPVAAWLLWRSGLRPPIPARWVGLTVLSVAVAVRWASSLAAELFTMRMSLLLAAAGLVLYTRGWLQIRAWWLPAALLALSVPIPDVLLNSIALPLQLQASQWGAELLEWRRVPVLLQGNVILLPGRSLFVTEACSGLRSLTALLALGLLIGGLWLRNPWSRTLLVVLTVPVAMVVNAIRVFLTGFLVYYVDPALGDGIMHFTEGWVLFIAAFAVLGSTAWLFTHFERGRHHAAEAMGAL